MSTFNGRRGPNAAQFLRDLTAIAPDAAAPEEAAFPIEDDLTMFTNTHFYDFESGQNTDFQAHPLKPESEQSTAVSPSEETDPSTSPIAGIAGIDFMTDFNFTEFSHYSGGNLGNFPDLQPLQPNQSVYASTPQYVQQQQQQQQATPRIGEKRKPEPMATSTSNSRQISFEEASRLAAEEDKRRRNTAASARFRIKKKQREQALEKSAKEMSEKVAVLETRIHELETENKWLKNMILEKNGGGDASGSASEKLQQMESSKSKRSGDSKSKGDA